jgi:hypothetical protein
MSASIHYIAARRAAIHQAERHAYHTRAAKLSTTPHSRPQARSRTLSWIAAGLIWASMLLGGLWLAAHDPNTLSNGMAHLLGDRP